MGCGASQTTTEKVEVHNPPPPSTGLHDIQGQAEPANPHSELSSTSQPDGLELLKDRMKIMDANHQSVVSMDPSTVSNTPSGQIDGTADNFPPSKEFDPSMWKKEKLLGRGAFGTVHRATNDAGEHVAVKTISFSESDPNVMKCLQLLQRELRTLRKVGDHPNIIQYYKSTRAKTSVHMFMEYCPGGSLKAKYARQGPFPVVMAARYTCNIVQGLCCLHQQDIVHRDIKCDNVLIDENDVAKLADFGASTILGEQQQHTRIGTVYWMAPEVLIQTGHRWQADIWSVGCTLMEMLTATRPFAHACKNQEQFFRLLAEDVPTPPLPPIVTDPAAVAFLTRALQKPRDERPTAAGLVADPFCSPFVVDIPNRTLTSA
eukprot:TRINITY_DN7819_c0_g1_i1.p1 TRINITY_DN7819_c0_g1~~TRINITY_DN7819_c0_g1_i1.p1  ORF type:complete len:374 (-),score=63.65 TRINITY_DN7819_c0_g1_i1:55-1176(-)